jgi:hypothetical protein
MGRKDSEFLNLSDNLMVEATNLIINGIKDKLAAAKKMIDYDKDIAAGIYVYALEELGKLQVLKDALNADSHLIKYRDAFLCHGEKFSKAQDCVIKFKHPECMYLTKGFSPISFSDESFTLALLVQTKARLGVFYVDFDYDKSTNTATKVKEIPSVDETMLRAAIDGLEDVISKWT